nr:MAG TPA: hypothetical protein [Caudoviricetes sp.]
MKGLYSRNAIQQSASSTCVNSPHSRIFYFYILCSHKKF